MNLWQDLRLAARRLAKERGFTIVAVVTLALGIGASTAIFTVVDSVLLRPLRLAEPQHLTMIRPSSGSRLSAAYLHDWRLQSRTFHDLAGWRDVRANLTGRGEEDACSRAILVSALSLPSRERRWACASRWARLTSWPFCAVSARCSWMPRMPDLTR